MGWRLLKVLLISALGGCLVTAFIVGIIFSSSKNFSQYPSRVKDVRFPQDIAYGGSKSEAHLLNNHNNNYDSSHRLAVIVPFRERFEELLTFVPHLHHFLKEQSTPHQIFVVNQVDTNRFNRAALINAGFHYISGSTSSFSYMAMHDVDLLPLNPQLPYGFPGEGIAMHVASLHPKYNYPSFIGGILLLTCKDFKKVDGMSNVYWGWGMEDDEFWVRLKQNSIQVKRADKLTTNRITTFRHIHSPKIRPRDHEKCFDQLARTKKRDRLTGLHNINYTLLSKVDMTVENAPVTVLNVQLHCDTQISPWCKCPTNATIKPSKTKSKSR